MYMVTSENNLNKLSQAVIRISAERTQARRTTHARNILLRLAEAKFL